MKSFRQWVHEFSPSWLVGEVGDKLIKAIGLTIDLPVETLLEAIYARFIYSTDFPNDALKYIGSERMMPRYPFETDASYKARLQLAWTSWTFAGTPQSVIEQLTVAGFDVEIKENWQWNWDNHPEDWSRFWVILRGHPWHGARWGEFYYGDGTTYNSSMTTADQDALRAIVRQWKPGHARCEYVIVVYDRAAWDAAQPPDGTWGDAGNRPPEAAYIPG